MTAPSSAIADWALDRVSSCCTAVSQSSASFLSLGRALADTFTGGATVHALTRSPEAQRLALELGAASANGAADMPPEPLDAAILFAPIGTLVLPGLAALDRGGTLAIAGIHLSDIPVLNYEAHLFEERTLRSVTANTREDGGGLP